jgi:hypothetical protein
MIDAWLQRKMLIYINKMTIIRRDQNVRQRSSEPRGNIDEGDERIDIFSVRKYV